MTKPKDLLKRKKTSLWLPVILLPIIFTTVAYGAVADYVGTYGGQFNGNYEESWTALVKETGEVFFTSFTFHDYTFDNFITDRGTLSLDDDGNVSGRTDLLGWQIDATIYRTNSGAFITGTYEGDNASGPLYGLLYPISSNIVGDFSGHLAAIDDDVIEEEDLIGTWNITVDLSGYVSGTMTLSGSETVEVDGVAESSDVYPISFIVNNEFGMGFEGWYNTEDEDYYPIRGWWCNTATGEQGLVIGERDSGPPSTDTDTASSTDSNTETTTGEDDDNGGSGSGGCFIRTLNF